METEYQSSGTSGSGTGEHDSGGHAVSMVSHRSVVHLAPDQLQRKRAFDRRNQRDSRARKQERIKDLELENLDLRTRVAALETELAQLPKYQQRQDSTVCFMPGEDPGDGAPRIWQVVPVSVPPMCRLDHVMHHLVSSGRQPDFLQTTIEEIAQSSFPRVVSLLNPAVAETAPVASMIGEHGPWMHMTSSAARIAVMYNICLYIRWLLSPTEINYLALPTHLRPVVLQLTTPHPRWIDIMPWPKVREHLITEMDWDTDFEEFRLMHNETASVNWPHPLSEILVSDAKNEISLNPVFEEHIRKAENFTASPELIRRFPYARLIPQHPI